MYFNNPPPTVNVGRDTPLNPVTVSEGVIEVAPDALPVMSPEAVQVIDWLAVKYATLLAEVTKPFAFTVKLLKVPILAFTVAKVRDIEVAPEPLASPEIVIVWLPLM